MNFFQGERANVPAILAQESLSVRLYVLDQVAERCDQTLYCQAPNRVQQITRLIICSFSTAF